MLVKVSNIVMAKVMAINPMMLTQRNRFLHFLILYLLKINFNYSMSISN